MKACAGRRRSRGSEATVNNNPSQEGLREAGAAADLSLDSMGKSSRRGGKKNYTEGLVCARLCQVEGQFRR